MGSARVHLEVAIVRKSLQLALSIVDMRGRAVFGTMDGRVLEKIRLAGTSVPVYFYEPG